mgnify:CR=1 FL=1
MYLIYKFFIQQIYMTSFYNKYYLDSSKESTGQNKNILKKQFTLNNTDYEKLKIAEQYNKLYSNTYKKNQSEILINENKKLYNLSFVQLINQSGPVYINLLNDLSIYLSKEETDKSLNKLGYILTKDMNLLYIGLLILALSFFLWLISVTK